MSWQSVINSISESVPVMNKVCVVIPIYSKTMSLEEEISLKRCSEIFSDIDVYFLQPQDVKFDKYYCTIPTAKVIGFPQKFFTSTASYNRLILSEHFYSKFIKYEYILIYQLDALVLTNELNRFCNLNYDYIGAPWNKLVGTYIYEENNYSVSVGNGGFSLRKVESCRMIVKKYHDLAEKWKLNEDVFFAHIGKLHPEEFKIAPISVASSFSLETNAEIFLRINGGKIPFGCHKWQLYCGNYYKEIFPVIGIKLPESYKFRNDDRVFFLNYLFSKALDKLVGSNILPVDTINNNLYIWGFGNNGKLIYERLLLRGVKVNGIYDRNRSGEVVGNITIGTIEQHDISKGVVLISSDKYENDMCAELETRGFCRKINYYTLADVVLSLNDLSNLTDDWYYGYKVL